MFKCSPYEHQVHEFQEYGDTPSRGIFWDPGLGKSASGIVEAAYLFERGEIDAVLIVAPPGVHINWTTDELPAHSVVPYRALAWRQIKSKTQAWKRQCEELLAHKGLAILSIAYPSLMTDAAKFIRRFLEKRRVLLIYDEVHWLKSPGAKRTIRAVAMSKYATWRRPMTGTPAADTPFDMYIPVKIIDPTAWKSIGCDDFGAFKANFGVFEKRKYGDRPAFDELQGYRNLDLLQETVSKYASRWREEEVLDLPKRLYTNRYFELTPEQRRVYEELVDDLRTTLKGGAEIIADRAITNQLRRQQITSGYMPTPDGLEPFQLLCDPNPRINLLLQTLEERPDQQVIVWAKFTQDIVQIIAALAREEISAVSYYGEMSEEECVDAKRKFQTGAARIFVGNPAKGSEGLTLTCAKTTIYYNNSHKLLQRTQSEKRFHRIGQDGIDGKVDVIDFIALDTIDLAIVECLRKKKIVTAQAQGDKDPVWIQ